MLPVLLVVSGRSANAPSSAPAASPASTPRPPASPPAASPPGAPFYSYGYLALTAALMVIYAIVSYVLPHSVLEIPLGLFALLFAPGYALAAPLFARQPGLSWTVNLPIVVGLSVVFNVLAGIALLLEGPGLTTWISAVIDLAAVVFGLLVFTAREATDPQPGTPPSVGEDLSRPLRSLRQRLRLTGYSRGQRAAAVTLLVLIVLVLGFIIYVAAAQPHEHLAVSFAMSGPGGTVSSLPSTGTNGSVLDVVLTVSNGATAQGLQIYVLSERVPSHGALTAVTWTQPLPLGNATYSTLILPLGAKQTATVPVMFDLSAAGNYTLTFTLENASGAPIQSFQLPLVITGAV
jgi:hypothetical protein